MTEEEAKQKGVDYEVKKLSMRYSGRFVAENEGEDGICKILINKKHRNVIGVHMLGNSSSEAIWGAAEMIENELRVKDVEGDHLPPSHRQRDHSRGYLRVQRLIRFPMRPRGDDRIASGR